MSAAPVSLIEFNSAGVMVQTINIPSTGGGTLCTLTYKSLMTDGWLSRASDGHSLTFGGYNAAVGSTNVLASSGPTRSIASIGSNAVVNLTTTTNALDGRAITGTATADGSRFWFSSYVQGAATTIGTTTLGASGAGTAVTTSNDYYAMRVIGGQLYATDFNTNIVRTSIPLPTGAATTSTLATYNSVGNTLFPGEFVLLDRSNAVAGVDTMYVAGQNGLQKFSFDGAIWTARGSVAGTFFGLTGSVTGANATLFGTTGEGQTDNNSFGRFVDVAAFNATISSSFTPLASAGTNFIFLGTEFTPTPVPEPTTLIGFAAIACTAVVRVFKKKPNN